MQRKPIDVGNGLVAASFGLDGCVLSVCAPHRGAGLVELTAAPRFPAGRRGDRAAVRRHRARLTDPAHALLRVVAAAGRLRADGQGWCCAGRGWDAEIDAWAPPGRPAVVQRFRVRRRGAGRLRLVLTGRLDRPDCAEITPVGPIPPPWAPGTLTARAGTLQLATSSPDRAGALVETSVHGVRPGSWSVRGGSASYDLSWDDDGASAFELLVSLTLGELPDGPTALGSVPPPAVRPSVPVPPDLLDRVADGATRYTTSCTALSIDNAHCCIVTDHRLLPLSWTRDAYYQAALLLCPAGGAAAVDVVRRHLTWLWGPGRDAAGVWQRSHLASGAVQDAAYQADQQLYPLLELADLRRVTGGWPHAPGPGAVRSTARSDGARWGELVCEVWSALPRSHGGLLAGAENPADDASTFPYLLSSQLLLAYVADRLAEWERELGIESLALHRDATRTLASMHAAFGCDGPYGPQWAYEADGRGGRRLYHDANDVPTALAPLWGLCAADDPHWRGTMRFAWSTHNPGFVPGPRGGLGSAHTPGVWPLGDAQEWLLAVTVDDHARAARVLAKLEIVTSNDGMLPETYAADTGEWLARHWFAWPGSLLGLLHRTISGATGPWIPRRTIR